MDPTDPKTDKLLLQVEGGGWGVASWSADNKKLLVVNEVSANETYLWLVDVATGEKKMLTPKSGRRAGSLQRRPVQQRWQRLLHRYRS